MNVFAEHELCAQAFVLLAGREASLREMGAGGDSLLRIKTTGKTAGTDPKLRAWWCRQDAHKLWT